MYRKSYCFSLIVGRGIGGVGISKIIKFYVKVFYVMGKGLSGNLMVLNVDRSCDKGVNLSRSVCVLVW